jgi:hypothetical protein
VVQPPLGPNPQKNTLRVWPYGVAEPPLGPKGVARPAWGWSNHLQAKQGGWPPQHISFSSSSFFFFFLVFVFFLKNKICGGDILEKKKKEVKRVELQQFESLRIKCHI